MLPVELNAHPFVEIPVETERHFEGAVAVAQRIGQGNKRGLAGADRLEHLMADAQLKRSSVMALGFRMLQEAGTIQRTRVEGNNKWFRLTPAMVRR